MPVTSFVPHLGLLGYFPALVKITELKNMTGLTIIGGGLSGCEAAWQAANRGINVELFEMRPLKETGAHVSPYLGELVCSNSFGSDLPDRASGLLKCELRKLNSLLIECADKTAVPAGSALAVDREKFAELVTEKIENHAHIKIVRQEYTRIPETAAVIASGPLTSNSLSESIAQLTGKEHLYFLMLYHQLLLSNQLIWGSHFALRDFSVANYMKAITSIVYLIKMNMILL